MLSQIFRITFMFKVALWITYLCTYLTLPLKLSLNSEVYVCGIEPIAIRFAIHLQKAINRTTSCTFIMKNKWHLYQHSEHMSCCMTKPTKWPVRPAKTQISLGIRPVWSEPLLCTLWVAKDPNFLQADSKDSGCPGWSASLLGTQSFWCFCHEAAHIAKFQKPGYWGVAWEELRFMKRRSFTVVKIVGRKLWPSIIAST